MEFIKYFIENRPDLVELMKNTHHDYSLEDRSPYHREGDVWTHSLMVAHFCPSTLALCHDIGKVFTRTVDHEKKQVSFKGHAGVSTYMSVKILRDNELEGRELEAHLFAISHHIRLYDFLKEKYSEKKFLEYYNGTPYANINRLIKLGDADNKGRISLDNSDKQSLDNIRDYLVKNYIEEIDEEAPNLYILVGPPACGKSTFLSKNLKERDVVISRDNLVEELTGANYAEKFRLSCDKEVDKNITECMNSDFKEAVKSSRDIYVDMTNLSPKSRRRWLNSVPKNYNKICYNFMIDAETIFVRNILRASKTGKMVPEKVIIDMMSGYTWPVYSEGFDRIVTIYED